MIDHFKYYAPEYSGADRIFFDYVSAFKTHIYQINDPKVLK